MISTVSMIRLGYVKGNRMTNVRPANQKLRERSIRILMAECGLGKEKAEEFFLAANNDLRIAIIMAQTGVNAEMATSALSKSDFVIRRAIEWLQNMQEDK